MASSTLVGRLSNKRRIGIPCISFSTFSANGPGAHRVLSTKIIDHRERKILPSSFILSDHIWNNHPPIPFTSSTSSFTKRPSLDPSTAFKLNWISTRYFSSSTRFYQQEQQNDLLNREKLHEYEPHNEQLHQPISPTPHSTYNSFFPLVVELHWSEIDSHFKPDRFTHLAKQKTIAAMNKACTMYVLKDFLWNRFGFDLGYEPRADENERKQRRRRTAFSNTRRDEDDLDLEEEESLNLAGKYRIEPLKKNQVIEIILDFWEAEAHLRDRPYVSIRIPKPPRLPRSYLLNPSHKDSGTIWPIVFRDYVVYIGHSYESIRDYLQSLFASRPVEYLRNTVYVPSFHHSPRQPSKDLSNSPIPNTLLGILGKHEDTVRLSHVSSSLGDNDFPPHRWKTIQKQSSESDMQDWKWVTWITNLDAYQDRRQDFIRDILSSLRRVPFGVNNRDVGREFRRALMKLLDSVDCSSFERIRIETTLGELLYIPNQFKSKKKKSLWDDNDDTLTCRELTTWVLKDKCLVFRESIDVNDKSLGMLRGLLPTDPNVSTHEQSTTYLPDIGKSHVMDNNASNTATTESLIARVVLCIPSLPHDIDIQIIGISTIPESATNPPLSSSTTTQYLRKRYSPPTNQPSQLLSTSSSPGQLSLSTRTRQHMYIDILEHSNNHISSTVNRDGMGSKDNRSIRLIEEIDLKEKREKDGNEEEDEAEDMVFRRTDWEGLLEGSIRLSSCM